MIAQYTYDEWGKLLEIHTEEEDDEEQLSIAEINPLRYRGYYYDNETGYYYLQSRYYDPELCRFISADSFEYIDVDTPMSVNAYAYCENNPLIYSDPTGYDATSDVGSVIGDLIGIIFLALEAQARLGDDFAYYIATFFTLNISLMHFNISNEATQKEKNEAKKKQRNEFFKLFNGLENEFSEFMHSAFYKIIKIIAPEFFFNFFQETVTRQLEYYSMTIAKVITITFGFGNGKSYFSTLVDAANGRFQITENGNLSSGLIIKDTSVGAYIQSIFDSVKNFYGAISLDLEFDKINYHHINSGYAVNTEFEYTPIMLAILIFLSIFSAGDLQKA